MIKIEKRTMVKTIMEKIKFLFFPQRCLLCGKFNNTCICNKCFIKIKKLQKFKVKKIKNKYFEKFLYIFEYKEIIRNKILNYKFNEQAYLNEFFVKIILKNKKICSFLKSYDIIIPVPIHKQRKRQRGYNQSELIARKIAENLGLEILENCIEKTKNTQPQSTLNKEQREVNIKGVYEIKQQDKVNGKKIILFDDIYTTGSTTNECARILKNNKCKEILVFTLAKD